MEKLYVKKLVSLNPDRYDYIERSVANSNYFDYLKNWLEVMTKVENNIDLPKDFENWLETEI